MTPDRREPDHPLHRRVADAVARLATLARSREQHESMAQELSPLQARALVALLRRGDLRVGEIGEELFVTYGTVSVALSALEEKDLVRKFQDPDEHRAVRIELTRRGRALANRAADWTAQTLAPAVADLSADEAGTLLATLLKMILALERSGAIARARMCVSCEHFVPGGGNRSRPHFCRLLSAAIGSHELRYDCPDHERADDRGLAETARRFRASP